MDKVYGRCMFSPISYSSVQTIHFNSLKHPLSSLSLLPLSLMLYMHFYNNVRVWNSAVRYLALPPSAADCCGYSRVVFDSKHEL